MTVSFSQSNQAASVTAQDIVLAALQEIGAIAPGEGLQNEDAGWGLEKLQRLIDQFNAQRDVLFGVSFQTFNLIPNHAPHLIGPAQDFNVPMRPVKVQSANFILNSGGSNPTDLPIAIKDHDWWAALPVKSQKSSIVTHLYYEASGITGNLNFWPVCTVANPVRMEFWDSIQQALDLNTVIGLPQAYWQGLVLSLAIDLCPSYEKEASMTLLRMQNHAMRVIQDNNDEPPRIDTSSSLPNSSKGTRPDFNFLTGLRE